MTDDGLPRDPLAVEVNMLLDLADDPCWRPGVERSGRANLTVFPPAGEERTPEQIVEESRRASR